LTKLVVFENGKFYSHGRAFHFFLPTSRQLPATSNIRSNPLDSRQLVDIFDIVATDGCFGPKNRVFGTENAAVGLVRGESNTVVLDIER
jgi:hypothetical protein